MHSALREIMPMLFVLSCPKNVGAHLLGSPQSTFSLPPHSQLSPQIIKTWNYYHSNIEWDVASFEFVTAIHH